MKTLMDNPPPLGTQERAEWNGRMDKAVAIIAARVAAAARQAGNEARQRGDMKAAVVAGEVERKARMLAQAGQ